MGYLNVANNKTSSVGQLFYLSLMTKNFKPLVSVIIPAYNEALYIREALKSVAEQTYSNLEVIVVNDHSSDKTEKIADDAFRRFGLRGQILLRPDIYTKGAGGSRNAGLAVANGELIAFLDSDDIWLSHHIENAVKCFECYGRDIVAYCCRAKILNPQCEKEDMFLPHNGFPITGQADIVSHINKRMFIPNQTFCSWRSSLEKTSGYHESLTCYEDWWLMLHLAKKGYFFCADDIGCLVRVRENSLSNWRTHRGRRYMSQAMFRDAIQICLFAQHSSSLTFHDIQTMRKSIRIFIRDQLRDNIRARYWEDAMLVTKGMLSTTPIDSHMILGIWAMILNDLLRLLFAKISQIIWRK